MTNLNTVIQRIAPWTTGKEITETEREKLTAAHMQDLGVNAYEAIEQVALDKPVTDKLIEALQETNLADRNVLLKEIGALLLKEAVRSCTKEIDEAIQCAESDYNQENGIICEAEQERRWMLESFNRQCI